MPKVEQRNVGVIDDDEGVRKSLRFLLEASGHFVETYESAVSFLNSETKHLACLILDHHVPRMTGLELAERLREDGSRIPILLMTGLLTSTILGRATDLEIHKVLAKPFHEEDLLLSVNGCAESQREAPIDLVAYGVAPPRRPATQRFGGSRKSRWRKGERSAPK
jgi:FixJ family two-component response regulator